jgi:hypothetical protein
MLLFCSKLADGAAATVLANESGLRNDSFSDNNYEMFAVKTYRILLQKMLFHLLIEG